MSVGEFVRWNVRCTSCDSTDTTCEPQPKLLMRVKCNECKHVRTVDPILTPLGEKIAREEFIGRLAAK